MPKRILALVAEPILQTFPADEIVPFTHPEGKRNWLEEGVVEEAERRFEAPVRHIIVDAG